MKRRILFALFFSVFFAFILMPAFAADADKPKGAAVETAKDTTEASDESVFQDLVKGGPTMIVIAICSMGTLYLIGDGFFRITNPKRAIPEGHVQALKGLFRTGDYVGAYKYCKNNPSAITNVTKAGLIMAGEGKNATEESVMAEVSKENARMQYFISYLSVIGVCTPMVGLLGTVFGMKHAFRTLKVSGVGNPSLLSGAIGEVLICTAFGLLIAIPAFFAFYWLRNRAANVIHHLQETIGSLFRKMPYEHLAGAQLGDEELFAALPNWVQGQGSSTRTTEYQPAAETQEA